jgi:hypothetical protein
MDMSRKFMLLFFSSSNVKFSFGVMLLNFRSSSCTRVYQKVPRLDLQTRMYLLDLLLGSIPFKIKY